MTTDDSHSDDSQADDVDDIDAERAAPAVRTVSDILGWSWTGEGT
jgi:hypothetical protein